MLIRRCIYIYYTPGDRVEICIARKVPQWSLSSEYYTRDFLLEIPRVTTRARAVQYMYIYI